MYGLGVPILLWLGLRYLGVGEWSVIETVALWGYGQFVWIPVSVCVESYVHSRFINGTLGALCDTGTGREMGIGRHRVLVIGLLPHFKHVSRARNCTLSRVFPKTF